MAQRKAATTNRDSTGGTAPDARGRARRSYQPCDLPSGPCAPDDRRTAVAPCGSAPRPGAGDDASVGTGPATPGRPGGVARLRPRHHYPYHPPPRARRLCARRSPSPGDKRAYLIEATPASQGLRRQVEDIWDQLEELAVGDAREKPTADNPQSLRRTRGTVVPSSYYASALTGKPHIPHDGLSLGRVLVVKPHLDRYAAYRSGPKLPGPFSAQTLYQRARELRHLSMASAGNAGAAPTPELNVLGALVH